MQNVCRTADLGHVDQFDTLLHPRRNRVQARKGSQDHSGIHGSEFCRNAPYDCHNKRLRYAVSS